MEFPQYHCHSFVTMMAATPCRWAKHGLLILLVANNFAQAQPGDSVHGTVVDAHGKAVVGARVSDVAGRLLTVTATDGSFT